MAAIESRNQNLLLSAAAGSGKTAVLVARILSRLTDKESPIKADRLSSMTLKSSDAQYSSFAAIETDDGKNIEFANDIEIKSGAIVILHYIFDVPKDMADGSDELDISLYINNVPYTIKLR